MFGEDWRQCPKFKKTKLFVQLLIRGFAVGNPASIPLKIAFHGKMPTKFPIVARPVREN